MKSGLMKGITTFAGAILLVSMSGPAPAQTNFSYSYDTLGRLKTVTYPNGTIVAYEYDPAGNRTQKAATPLTSGFTQTIQVTGEGPVNLRTLANSAGYNGAQAATITFEVGNGVAITGSGGSSDCCGSNGTAGGIALDTGTWPTGYAISLSLVVKTGGAIRGGGGGGGGGGGNSTTGEYAGAGGAGGDAVYVQAPISITVQSGGEIKGGGNGGAGGYGYSTWNTDWGDYEYKVGGDGGGGYPNGSPNGTIYGGGAGTPGEEYFYTADGETGGGPGGGSAVRKNGHTVPITNNGTIVGATG